ncbi:hypothetical protein HMPREF1576_00465, partial [Gardnerella pickettii JCP7719]
NQHNRERLMLPTIFPHKRSNHLQIFTLIILNKQLLKLRNLIFWNNQQALTMRNQTV